MKKLSEFKSEHSERVEDLKRQIKDREAQLQAYRREHGKLENFFDEVISEIQPLTPLPATFKPGERKGESIVVPISQATDWHIGEIQKPYEIEDFNEFNYRIACDRVLDFTERYIDWVTLHRNVYNINEAAILVTGDLIAGDIHDELRVTNEFPTPVQVVKAAELLSQHFALIAPHFEKLTVHFITEDNHARLTKKPQAKEASLNSFNYLVGKLTEAYTAQITNLDFNLYPALEKVVNVNGMRYLISHGHSVRGWMGVPWYGIERKVGKESQARLQLIMEELDRAKTIGFDKYVIGHFHTPFDSSLYACGGSLAGTSAYDHQAGRYSPPSQSAWMVHEKHKEFNRINFKL
jgi:hypothetical protein